MINELKPVAKAQQLIQEGNTQKIEEYADGLALSAGLLGAGGSPEDDEFRAQAREASRLLDSWLKSSRI